MPHDEVFNCALCFRFSGKKPPVKRKHKRGSQPRKACANNPEEVLQTSASLNDHCYATISPAAQFALKRKRDKDDRLASKQRLLDLDMLQDQSHIKDKELCSMYDADLCLAKPIHETYTCKVCFGICDEPYVTPCSHVGCKACLQKWTATFTACPDCQEAVSLRDLQECDVLFKRLLLDLPMKCPNSCPKVLSVATFEDHINICNSDCSVDSAGGSTSSEAEDAMSSEDIQYTDMMCTISTASVDNSHGNDTDDDDATSFSTASSDGLKFGWYKIY